MILNSLPAMNKDTRSVADLVPFIVQKLKHLAVSGAECKPPKRQRQTFSLSEVESSPNTLSGSSTWQEKLETYAEIEIGSRSKSLVQLVRQICGDLANAEEPLQWEKARSAELDRSNTELTEEIRTLKADILDKDIALGALESQMSDSSQANAATVSENNDLLEQVSVLGQKLDEALETGSVQLSEVQRKLDQQQLELHMSYESKKAMSAEFVAKLTLAKEENDKLRAAYCEQKEVEDQLQIDIAFVNSRFAECKLQLDKEASTAVQLQVGKFDAEQQLLTIRKTFAEVDIRYNEAIAEMENMRLDHHRALKDQETKISHITSNHDLFIQQKSEEADSKEKSLQFKLEDAYETFQQEKTALEQTLEQRDSVINGMEDETQHLNSIISEQESLISSLKLMRKVGGAAFTDGINEARQTRGPAHAAKQTRDHTRKLSTVSRRRGRGQTVQFNEEPPRSGQGKTPSPTRPGGSTSRASSCSGPTPKRAKPMIRRASVTRSVKACDATISHSSRSRAPLSDVSSARGNASPTKTRLLVGLTKERALSGVLEEKFVDSDLLGITDDFDFSLSHLSSTPKVAFGKQDGGKGKSIMERDPDSTMDE
jgi:hypothetical protein